jgi:hypothetical protein
MTRATLPFLVCLTCIHTKSSIHLFCLVLFIFIHTLFSFFPSIPFPYLFFPILIPHIVFSHLLPWFYLFLPPLARLWSTTLPLAPFFCLSSFLFSPHHPMVHSSVGLLLYLNPHFHARLTQYPDDGGSTHL